MAPAPDFVLPSAAAGPLSLQELTADGPALLVFVSEECPTSTLTLRRLAPAVPALQEGGLSVAAVFADPLEVGARTARRAGFSTTVLSEPAPYDISRAYGVQTVPTAVLVDPTREIQGRIVGWDADGLQALLDNFSPASSPPRLTRDEPLRKPGCAAKCTLDPELVARLDAAAPFDELEEMFERGWTDGLPVIPPTPERVQAMLGGRDGAESLGPVPPGQGEATLERVAACAVLAGCRPDYFPVVLAAARAALKPEFNLNGQAVTTQPAGQLVVVNGPVRQAVELNGGVGVLGPGQRANLTIGRALRLLVSLTGQGYPGRMDRATLGHPGKLGFCIAEDEETSPWEPFHVERGYEAGQSVVTLIACDAPLSISDHRSQTPEELTRVLGWAAAATWSPNWWPLGAPSLFVICPEHAEMFRHAGWNKDRVRQEMFAAVRRPAGELRWGETTPQVLGARDEDLIPKWTAPEDILLLVAGGEAGRYSAVLGPCTGMGEKIVSEEVRWNS
ncbi:MAG TPA: redoxin domain-containing protein [Solirubrobacteraceae bacterium]|jgi:peroxiredoxin|nr:redoxin domain-containing protein [Solirubrobacteraceae bacterium]